MSVGRGRLNVFAPIANHSGFVFDSTQKNNFHWVEHAEPAAPVAAEPSLNPSNTFRLDGPKHASGFVGAETAGAGARAAAAAGAGSGFPAGSLHRHTDVEVVGGAPKTAPLAMPVPPIERRDWRGYAVRKARDLGMRVEPIKDPSRWWTNGHIVCNVDQPNVWGEANVEGLRDMWRALAAERLTDADGCWELYVNKRDVPILTRDYEAHTGRHMYAGWQVDTAIPGRVHVPIFSFYTGAEFSDLSMPTVEDWLRATGRAVIAGKRVVCFKDEVEAAMYDADSRGRDAMTAVDAWLRRSPKAVFRGSATGRGLAPGGNLRLTLVDLAAKLKEDGNAEDAALLDVGITQWSQRCQVSGLGRVDHMRPSTFRFGLSPRLSFGDQMGYRFILYVEGHSGASRFSSCMGSGAVTLWFRFVDDGKEIEGTPTSSGVGTWAPALWYFDRLVRGTHYIVVTPKTLIYTIKELNEDPDRASRMVLASYALYRDVICSRKLQLDHLERQVRDKASAPSRRHGPFGMAAAALTERPPPPDKFRLPFGGAA